MTSQNCQHYTLDTGIYYCISCKKGYTGKVETEPNNNKNYVTCDTAITGCSTDTYGGFYINRKSEAAHNFKSDLFFTCHKCSSGFIPFLFIDIDTSNNNVKYLVPTPFKISNDTPNVTEGSQTSADLNDVQVKCVKPEPASFSMSSFQKIFPDNCGLGLFNTTVEKSSLGSGESPLYCAECASGYQKIHDQASNVVTECKAISNCDPNRTDHWFNACSKCLNTHAWSYTGGAINFDNCVTRNIENCEVVDNTGPNQVCKYCAKGFDLINNRCEKHLVAKCGAQYNKELIPTESFWYAAKK